MYLLDEFDLEPAGLKTFEAIPQDGNGDAYGPHRDQCGTSGRVGGYEDCGPTSYPCCDPNDSEDGSLSVVRAR